MGEAEKIDNISEPKIPAAEQQEEEGLRDIFYHLGALIGRDDFDLRAKIKRVKGIDDRVKEEALTYVDEALGLVSSFERNGYSEQLAAEAGGYFDVLMEMGEKHIPDFDKELTLYNHDIKVINEDIKAKKAVSKKDLPDADSVDAHTDGEHSEKNAGESGKVIRLVKPADAAAPPPTADENQEFSAIKHEEGGLTMSEKNSDDEYQGESPRFKEQAKRFRDVHEAGRMNMEDIGKKPVKGERKKTGGKEPPGGDGESEEVIKKQLDEAYKNLYGFLNDKKDAPKETYDELARLEQELYGVLKDRTKVGEIGESLKEKYRKRVKSGDRKKEKLEKKETEEKKVETKLKEKKEAEKELKIEEGMITRRAEEIKQRRLNNEKNFEWAKIDDLLRSHGIEPGTPAAAEYLAKWDRNQAESELRREMKQKEKESGIASKKIRADRQKDIVDEMITFNAAETERIKGAKTEAERMRELARLGAEITLSKITNYDELWAQTEQEGDEKFKQKTRELWKEFAVHGKVLKDKMSGKVKVMEFTDLDGNSSLGLLELAGIDTKNLAYKEPGEFDEGKINIDTGERHGIIVEDGGKTVFIDHHSDESGKDSSATKFTYELLVSLGLLEKQEYLDKLVEFVTQEDNKNYPGEEKYFKNYWRNLFGLKDNIKFKHLLEFFKAGHKPYEVLQPKELKKMGLLKISEKKQELVEESLAELERIKDKGVIIETPRYGKIVVDIDKKIPGGFDAIRYAGYQTYISWAPADNSFFISSVFPVADSFSQGKKIRGTMWIKPMSDDEPLTVTLKEILIKMTDGQFALTGELAEFIEREEQISLGEKLLKEYKIETLEQLLELEKLLN